MKVEAKLPRGILLVGPPGTGKTLLAHAVAGEARVPLFSISVELGTAAVVVTDLFRKATANAPSIVFIDNIEAISMSGETTFNHQLHPAFSQLLKEMDKVKEDASKVLVLAATNVICPTTLDSALMGSSRFFKKVSVNKPDEDGRRKILGLYMKDLPIEENEAICALVASLTEGLVGADLENITDESRRLAARRGSLKLTKLSFKSCGDRVTCDDVVEAVKRIKFQNYHDTN
ncbi:hypothetical protein OSB04_018239 [Centaurea solstitialis]|uniref:AAA+ ATPase domain-containing protein n=1 Tax=Centaurea solstitialis TaxID=347529 RepID=A0AA38WLI3_9ASTR|nr:hypothetical protein OSB04_018239 [Centaurea solstitialis]